MCLKVYLYSAPHLSCHQRCTGCFDLQLWQPLCKAPEAEALLSENEVIGSTARTTSSMGLKLTAAYNLCTNTGNAADRLGQQLCCRQPAMILTVRLEMPGN